MQYTSQAQLKASTVISDLPITSLLFSFLKHLCETIKCETITGGLVRKEKKEFSFPTDLLDLSLKSFHGILPHLSRRF